VGSWRMGACFLVELVPASPIRLSDRRRISVGRELVGVGKISRV